MEPGTVAPTAAYLAHEAGMLAGVPGERIGQWARWGHIRASVSAGEPHVYAFGDVAEALAVHLLLDAGFTLPLVRRAVERLGGAAAAVADLERVLRLEPRALELLEQPPPPDRLLDLSELSTRGGPRERFAAYEEARRAQRAYLARPVSGSK
jgi:hypothetical protein